ncbi:hypothetical protein DEU56DRAFT_332969 [Suillus clintonianus]|uniref:uncharacterized protein n=1 Tax=Suillus clintonianus TaxID=1904413 RepID=UPI001B870AC8|nr:uncharacterized protein DEU56DRAFT_332969 [Suillus clintonianus]KAG2139043.1 hypothetical protein DEU56DRAFT_332969 [Suillus clintonianus]
MPAVERNTSVACTVCDKVISRKADLPRHMRTHAEDKEALMHACPFPNCDHKTLQKSNMLTHIRTHTREFSKTCPHPGCAFATTDPGSLTRHRKVLHGYEPKARCRPGGKAARRSAAAPYPSTQFMKPEAEIPASLDLNEPAFPELAGLVRCDALSPAESSGSGIPQISGELDELPWERLFPDIPVEAFTSVYDQPSQLPIPTSNYYQPPTVPAGPSTLHMPQFDPELSSNVNYQQPVPDMPAELDEFLQKYGSGFFEGRCEYPDSATYSMAQPSFTNEHNAD